MTIASVDNVRIKLGRESFTPFENEQVQFYLDQTEPLLISMFGDFSQGDKTDKIKYCDLRDGEFRVENPNPTALLEINGQTFTGSLNTDYIIDSGRRKIIVKNIHSYITNREFDLINVKYTSGYEQNEIPKDLIYFHCLLVEGELNKEGGKEVRSERLGPRTVTFVDTPQNLSLYQSILDKYLKITIC